MTAVDVSQTRELAELHGTPLYVYDAVTLRQRSAELRGALPGATLLYSLKANPNVDVASILRSTGCHVEVASGGELEIAVKAGFEPEHIIFIGPGKTRREIGIAEQYGVRRFVVDNLDELSIIRQETGAREVAVRINPDFEARGGKLTMGGGRPKQFGIDRPQVREFVDHARFVGLDVTGLHYYLGTRFLQASDIVANTERIIADAAQIADECSLRLGLLDMGGGFGVPYFDNETTLDMKLLAEGLGSCLAEARRVFPDAELAFESGRFLTADAGRLVLEVLTSKTSYGTTFAICDGGTNLNMAAIGTGSLGKRNFPSQLITTGEPRQGHPGPVTVTGPLCTPDDTLLKAVEWPRAAAAGDYVVLTRVGAYGPSASPHSFLGHRYPDEVVIDPSVPTA